MQEQVRKKVRAAILQGTAFDAHVPPTAADKLPALDDYAVGSDEVSFSLSSETRSVLDEQDEEEGSNVNDISSMSAVEAYSKTMAAVFSEGSLLNQDPNDGTGKRAVSKMVLRSRGVAIRIIVSRQNHKLEVRAVSHWRAAMQRSCVLIESGIRRRQFALVDYSFNFIREYYKSKVALRCRIDRIEMELEVSHLRSVFLSWCGALAKNEVHECDWDCGFCGTRDEVLQHESTCPAMHAGTAWKAQTSISTRSALKAPNQTQFSSRAPRTPMSPRTDVSSELGSPSADDSEIQLELEFSRADKEIQLLTLYEGESERQHKDGSSISEAANTIVSPAASALLITMLLGKIATVDAKLANRITRDLVDPALVQPLSAGLDSLISAVACIKAHEIQPKCKGIEAEASQLFAKLVLKTLPERYSMALASKREGKGGAQGDTVTPAQEDYEERIMACALCDFVADQPNKLSLKKGDKVAVILTTASGWAYGTVKDPSGRFSKGWFPATFVSSPKVTALTLPVDSGDNLNEAEKLKQQKQMTEYLGTMRQFISHQMQKNDWQAVTRGELTNGATKAQTSNLESMPVSVVLTFDADFSIMFDDNVSLLFDSQIRSDVSYALKLHVSCVSVIFYREGSIVVGLVLRADESSERTGMQLALDLIRQVNLKHGEYKTTTTGGLAISAALQGPVAESLVTSMEANRHPWCFSQTSSKIQSYLRRLIQSKTDRCTTSQRCALLTASFEGWLSCAEARLIRRRKIWNAVLRWSNGSLCAAFANWKAGVAALKQTRHVAKKVIMRFFNRLLATAFQGWHAATSKTRHIKDRASNIIYRLSNRTSGMAFDRYSQQVNVQTALRKNATRTVLKLKNLKVARAFDSWVQALLGVKAQVQRQGSTLQAWMNLSEHRAFVVWQEHAQELKGLRSKAYKVVARLKMRCCVLALDTWIQSIESSKSQRAVLSRVLAKMLMRCVSVSFAKWEFIVISERSRRNKSVKVISRILNLRISKSFDLWRLKVKKFLRLRRTITKCSGQWHKSKLSSALRTWVASTSAVKDLEFKSRKAVKRWINQTLANGFGMWVSNVHKNLLLRGKSRGVVAKWMKQELWHAMDAWSELKRRSKRRKLKGLQCMQRWRKSALSTYYMCWALRTQQKGEIREMILRSAFKCSDDRIRTAFSCWSDAKKAATKGRLNSLSKGLSAHPTAMSVALDLDFDSTFASSNDRISFETQLQTDVCDALDIERERVSVLCHQKGSVVSEIVFGNPKGAQAFDSEHLALTLINLVGKPGSALGRTSLGKLMKKATLHGPICEEALRALMAAKNSEESNAEFSLGETEYRMLLPMLKVGQESHALLEEGTRKLDAQFNKLEDMRREKLKKILLGWKFKTSRGALTAWHKGALYRKKMRLLCRRILQRMFNSKMSQVEILKSHLAIKVYYNMQGQ